MHFGASVLIQESDQPCMCVLGVTSYVCVY